LYPNSPTSNQIFDLESLCGFVCLLVCLYCGFVCLLVCLFCGFVCLFVCFEGLFVFIFYFLFIFSSLVYSAHVYSVHVTSGLWCGVSNEWMHSWFMMTSKSSHRTSNMKKGSLAQSALPTIPQSNQLCAHARLSWWLNQVSQWAHRWMDAGGGCCQLPIVPPF